jgi:hypothetical protein
MIVMAHHLGEDQLIQAPAERVDGARHLSRL